MPPDTQMHLPPAFAELTQPLAAGLDALGLGHTPMLLERLLRYLMLLERWNKAYNLTAVRVPAAMLTRHILDSLSLSPWVVGSRLLDIGSGAGLPGVPLALLRPELTVVLLDSNAKKTRFLQQVVLELPLPNVEIVWGRVEAYAPAVLFDTVTARALSELAEVWRWARRLGVPGGRILLLKGEYPAQELAALPLTASPRVLPLVVPGLSEARHLVWLTA
jgi:16S rRNA (guanine527-N7)-methyltransferase